jgi:hypothetical protein
MDKCTVMICRRCSESMLTPDRNKSTLNCRSRPGLFTTKHGKHALISDPSEPSESHAVTNWGGKPLPCTDQFYFRDEKYQSLNCWLAEARPMGLPAGADGQITRDYAPSREHVMEHDVESIEAISVSVIFARNSHASAALMPAYRFWRCCGTPEADLIWARSGAHLTLREVRTHGRCRI